MLKRRPASERIFGVLLASVGGFVAYPAWAKLYSYMQGSQIVFDSRRDLPTYGQEAAFWYLAYLLLGLAVAAWGVGMVVRK